MTTTLFLIMGLVAGLSWLVFDGLMRAYRAYELRLKDEARVQLDEFFLFLDPAQLWLVLTLACGLVGTLVFWFSGQWWLAMVIALMVLFAPRLVLRRVRQRRRDHFDRQLPDLLQALAGALRAGSGVQRALQHIISQSPAPLSQEFGLLLREQRMGVSFAQALTHLYQRMPTSSCSLVVSALNIAAQSGGSLAETLEGIAQTLRARRHWMGRIQALTAQGRMQSWIMASLPMLLLGVLYRLEPEVMSLLWSSVSGGMVLGLVLVLEGLGIVLIRRIVAIDV
ncbi:type II secretion system F family protein [Alcaligenaceae bacterium CGII-47]|nr:type II secretion system F family protein [Alcaligenaceae bacterium CGII-47]